MKFLNAFIVVFTIIMIQSSLFADDIVNGINRNSTGEAIAIIENESTPDSTKEAGVLESSFSKRDSRSSSTVKTSKLKFLIGGLLIKSDNHLLDDTDMGPAFKIALILREHDSKYFPSFVEINYIKGLKNAKEISFINYMFGKGFIPKFSNLNFGIIFEIGVGVSFSDTPLDDSDWGLLGLYRIGGYYKSVGFSLSINTIRLKGNNFDILALNLFYTF
ncbi:MAG: hypothetical protein PF588_04100 [Candidatus Kapabacteria bacterium]|jgi:hypothetical protein|nr:hypothetical protein [Candidatus Kapabacteria bacterium]